MIWIIKNRKQIWKVAALITVITAWAAGIVIAGDNIKIRSIDPVPDFMSEEVSKSGKRNVIFHGQGTIDRFGKDDAGKNIIIVDDLLIYFAPNVNYYSSEGSLMSSSQFQAGKNVGYLINNKNEITDLYIIREGGM